MPHIPSQGGGELCGVGNVVNMQFPKLKDSANPAQGRLITMELLI